jgi:outer membrane protein assembly factor BamB
MNAMFVAMLLPFAPADAPSADVWPQWRGPTHDSVAVSSKLPVHWSATENVVWKTSIPGQGNSSPCIWQDAIFVTAQDKNRLVLLRIDRGTGKIVWEREVGQGTPRRTGPPGINRYHDENNMASPSPVTDGKYVWAHFGTGHLACFDFSGERMWALNFTERFGPYTIWWGHANTPCLVGKLLISVCIQDPKGGGQSYVVAHDKNTGKEKWFVKRDTGATSEPADSYTTPIPYTTKGRTELIVFGGTQMDSYEPATGKHIWQCAFKGNRVISGPTLAGDTVYAAEGMKGSVLAVRADGTGDVTATHVRWRYSGATPDAASPVVAKGLVFIATNAGVGICIDADTGKEVWKQRLSEAFRATPLVSGDKVYLCGKDGKTSIVEASRTFRVIAECDLAEDTIASPAAAGDNLYLRTRGHLWRIGAK